MKVGIQTNIATAIALGSTAGTGPELMGWELTTSNVGLAPFGLNGATLPEYTTNPVPAGTTITEKKIVWSGGELNLDAGGITIERCLLQPNAPLGTGTSAFVQSFTPPNPNIIKDSELDGSLLGQEDAAFKCGLRGIWSEISRNYIHGMGSGICLVDYTDTLSYDMIYTNNLIVDMRGFGDPETTGSHNEAATTRCARIDINPSRRMVWRGNWIDTSDAPGNSSGGLFIQTTFGCPIGNLYVENNYIDGGPNWDVYADGASYSGQFESTNNRFVSGGFGYCAVSGFTFDVWDENYVNDPGQPDNKGASIAGC